MEDTKQTQFRLSEEDRKLLSRLGNGSMKKGLDKVLEAFKDEMPEEEEEIL